MHFAPTEFKRCEFGSIYQSNQKLAIAAKLKKKKSKINLIVVKLYLI